MGIYVFDAEYLYKVLQQDAENPDSHRDFGMAIIPALVREKKAYDHDFTKS